MRQPRIKIPADLGEATYHCISRTVNGEWLLDEVAREVLRRMIWQVADYCGLEILTYAVLSNHFHILVRVPQKTLISDVELLRRYAVLYPRPTRYQTARLDVIRLQLATNGPEAAIWRGRQLSLMGDLSPFMQLLKQRFSIWFNRTHQRFGTLWSERFKSVLVESGRALQAIAAYIDLNPVRAGLTEDPKDYRFCGYAEAVAGTEGARSGLVSVLNGSDWKTVQAGYRQMLYGIGADDCIPSESVGKVLSEGGQLPLSTILRCRIRYFSDGAVIGTRGFVTDQIALYKRRTGTCLKRFPKPVPSLTKWGELTSMRGIRHNALA